MFGRYLMNMRRPLSLKKLFHDMHQNQRGAKKRLLNRNVLAAPTKNSHEQAQTFQKMIYNIIWKDVAAVREDWWVTGI